ncbi:MAG: nuclear transport factor 2 family protein [Burkholderiaceae bacterium]
MRTLSQLYKDFLDAWSRGDIEAMSAYYHDDIVSYPNRSMRPLVGKAAVLEFLGKFGKGMSAPSFEQTLMMENGDTLFVEGTESYVKNGRHICIPYAGVVEFRDGKIIAKRDYFDLKSLEKQLAG